MSLKLLRVELRNFRTHEYLVFVPEETGLTVLQGPNGSGKSSVLDAVAWALMGTKPSGVSRHSELFRAGLGEKDPAYVLIDMEIDGKRYRFDRRRVNKHGHIELEVSSIGLDAQGKIEYKNLSGPAVSHAEPFVRQLLRMDEKGFLASVLVQQKQVDQLISASPRERGQVIEKLTGIAGVTSALTEAKQDLNSLRKAVSFSTIDEAGLEKLKQEKSETEGRGQALKEEIELLKVRAAEQKKSGEALKEKLEVASSLYEKHRELERDREELKTRKILKEEELERVLQEKEEAKKSLLGASEGSLETLEEQMRELREERTALALLRREAEGELRELRETEKRHRATLEGTVPGDAAPVVESKLKSVEDELSLTEGQLLQLRAEYEQVSSALGIIEAGDSCPTCMQKVGDISAASAGLRTLLASNEKKTSELTKAKANMTSALGKIKIELEERIRRDEAELWLKDSNRLMKTASKQVDARGSESKVLEKNIDIFQKKLDEAKHAKLKRDAHRKLLERAQTLTEEVENIDHRANAVKKELSELSGVSQREVSSLQKKLDEARNRHSATAMDYSNKNGEIKLEAQKLSHLKKDIRRHEEDIQKHNDLVQAVGIAAHAHEVIGEFREERIRTSIPVIEVYASDLLSRFTEGKFTRLSLNQKFEATVYLADGTPRAVGLLSGGELSAAAMALRLAISLLLNSGAGQNLLVLDEVLVSQDAHRAEQILTTLKEIAHGQVILVAHNESIDSVADKVIKVKELAVQVEAPEDETDS